MLRALWVEDPLLDLSSESSDAYLPCLLLLLLMLCDSLGPLLPIWVNPCWSVLGIFSVPGPTIHTKMIFISTLVTLFAPCWAFSWQVRLSTSAACLTRATLGSMAITFLEFEGFGFINGCCCGNSTIGLVSVEVFYCNLMLFGILEKGFVCDFLSFFDLTHFLTLKCYVAWKVVLSDILFSHSWCYTCICL